MSQLLLLWCKSGVGRLQAVIVGVVIHSTHRTLRYKTDSFGIQKQYADEMLIFSTMSR